MNTTAWKFKIPGNPTSSDWNPTPLQLKEYQTNINLIFKEASTIKKNIDKAYGKEHKNCPKVDAIEKAIYAELGFTITKFTELKQKAVDSKISLMDAFNITHYLYAFPEWKNRYSQKLKTMEQMVPHHCDVSPLVKTCELNNEESLTLFSQDITLFLNGADTSNSLSGNSDTTVAKNLTI